MGMGQGCESSLEGYSIRSDAVLDVWDGENRLRLRVCHDGVTRRRLRARVNERRTTIEEGEEMADILAHRWAVG